MGLGKSDAHFRCEVYARLMVFHLLRVGRILPPRVCRTAGSAAGTISCCLASHSTCSCRLSSLNVDVKDLIEMFLRDRAKSVLIDDLSPTETNCWKRYTNPP